MIDLRCCDSEGRGTAYCNLLKCPDASHSRDICLPAVPRQECFCRVDPAMLSTYIRRRGMGSPITAHWADDSCSVACFAAGGLYAYLCAARILCEAPDDAVISQHEYGHTWAHDRNGLGRKPFQELSTSYSNKASFAMQPRQVDAALVSV